MVRLTMTPAIVQALEYIDQSDISGTSNDSATGFLIEEPAAGKPISHGELIDLSRHLQKLKQNAGDDLPNTAPLYTLDQLLRGSRVYVEPVTPRTEPTSDYKALMTRLRREEEARAYERMINPPLPAETFSQRFPNSSHAELFSASQADFGGEDEISYADINRQMTLIINILLSIVACSVAIWLAARHWSTPSRLGLSMGGSSLIGVAEIVVYAGYLRKVKEARDKGKKEVEIKEVVKTWVIGGAEERKIEEQAVPIDSQTSSEKDLRRRKATAR